MKKLKVFCASIATETNTFSPLRTDFSDFEQSFYAAPGEHPETSTLCTGIFPALRKRAEAGQIELIEGTATWAEPGGMMNATTWVRLRDEVLGQLRDAGPLDAVVLGLHGAMVADGYGDCDGELIVATRSIVGPDVTIGVTFDPHSNLSAVRTEHADIVTVFKEFPHTDFVEIGETCVELTLKTARGEIEPAISVFDVKMMTVLPTSVEPMRSFVDKMNRLEREGHVLSISATHGFMAGDSPDLGAKIIVTTDNDAGKGDALAESLGHELYSFRNNTLPEFLTAECALAQASELSKNSQKPIVVADVWDNPGGGVAGDSTIMVIEAMKQGLTNIAVGTIWDPMAVKLCHAAGEGSTLDLRFGGKTSAHAGPPIDAHVKVNKIVRNAVQSFGSSIVPLGNSASISFEGVEIILNSNRSQAFSPDLFTNLGVDAHAKKILIVKSTNHFHGAFAPIAEHIVYAAYDGPYPNNPATNDYKNLTRNIWPRVENPHESG